MRPARFSETMRRVRLEKESARKNWTARRSHPKGPRRVCEGAFSRAAVSEARDGEASSALRPESGWVRSSNGQNCRLFRYVLRSVSSRYPTPDRRRRQLTNAHETPANQVS